jgi:DnaJ-class molecular chaperone
MTSLADMSESIERAFLSTKDADYYQILGVDREATPTEIRVAYYRLAERLHPDLHHYWMTPDMGRKLTTLFSRVVESYKVLNDRSKRRQYDLALGSGVVRLDSSPKPKPARPIEYDVQNLTARKFFMLGRKALQDSDPKSAKISLQFALSLEPSNATIIRECKRADALISN